MYGPYWIRYAKIAYTQRSYKTLCWAILIAGVMLSCVHMTEQRLHMGLKHYGRTLLGSDVMLISDQEMPKSWQHQAKTFGLFKAPSYQWHTMAEGRGIFQLVNIVAVPQAMMSTYFSADRATRPLQKNEVYITPALAQKLNLNATASLTFNGHTFHVAGFRSPQPFRMSHMRALLAPTVWMSMADMAQLDLFELGAQVDRVLFISGSPKKVAAYIQHIKPTLKPGQKIRNITALQTLGNRFQQVHHVLAWFAWMGMVFAVLVVGMAIQRYLSAQRNTIILLASFGHPPARTLQFFVAMCGLGMVVMLCVALAITGLLHMLLHFWLPPWAQGLWPMFEGLHGAGMALGWGMAMGLSVLCPLWHRHHLTSHRPTHGHRHHWIGGLPACLVLLSYGIVHMGPSMTSAWIVFLVLIWLCFVGLSYGCKYILKILTSRTSFLTRCALRMTLYDWAHHQRHIWMMGIIATLLGCWVLIIHALSAHWLKRLPAQTPNVFLMQVMPKQQQAIDVWFQQHDLHPPHLFPAIRGRLLSKNGVPIRAAVPIAARQHNALGRSLTFSEGIKLPSDNHIVTGTWQPHPKTTEVSLEQTFAQQLGFKLGDRLGITVQAQKLYATVTSIRALNWLDFSPNFYCFFSPGTFTGMARTLFGSFYLPQNHHQTRLQAFYAAFPNVVVLDLSSLFTQIQRFSQTIALVLSVLLSLVLSLGAMVFGVCLLDHRHHQQQDGHIIQQWGASKAQQRCCFMWRHACMFALTLLFTWFLLRWTTSSLIHHAFDVDRTPSLTPLSLLLTSLWACLMGILLWLEKYPSTSDGH